jgi:drug/metabolite transporter (DMT)-like permease
MTLIDTLLFMLLAAIWGSSFIFMRALAPILGPVATALARTLVAGLFLLGLFTALRAKMELRKNFRHYLVVGLLNSGVPFVLYSFAATRLPASIPAIVNALTPLWGAVFSALILKDPLTLRKLFGLVLGVAGVALIALRGSGLSGPPEPLAVACCVGATVCYGVAGAYIKRWASSIPSRAMTAASLTFAGLSLLPFALIFPPPAAHIGLSVWVVAAVFSLLCSALAYLIYFRLIASAGVTVALSVTLLVPVFAFLWGFLFLGERIYAMAVAGAALVLAGTALVIFGNKRKKAR